MFTRVRGNTIQFAMPLQDKTFYAGGIAVRDFVPQEGDKISVIMQDRKAFTYTPTYSQGMLHWIDNGELEVGVYSVEVVVERGDTVLRCLRVNQVNIVEANQESEIDVPIVRGTEEEPEPVSASSSEDETTGEESDGEETESTIPVVTPDRQETILPFAPIQDYPEPGATFYPKDILGAGVFIFAGEGGFGIREIAEGVFSDRIIEVRENLVHDYEAKISVSARELRTEYTEDISDAVRGVTQNYRSEISQTAQQIQSTVEATARGLDGRLTQQQSQITQQAGLIALKVSQTDYDANNALVSQHFSSIEQTATNIQLTVAENKRTADGQYQELSGELTVQAGLIATKVSQTDYDANNIALGTRFSTIEQTASGIALRVTNVENEFGSGGRVTIAESAIEQNAAAIALKVSTTTYEQGLLALRQDLENQIDGAIDTWFNDYSPVPTSGESGLLTNVSPYSDWVAEETRKSIQEKIRDMHVGDIFYDTASGYAYRFEGSGNPGERTYIWRTISDSAVVEALQKANEANALAGTKCRTFVIEPYPPYNVGDLWVKPITLQGTQTTTIYRCSRARTASEYFTADDWSPADDYSIKLSKSNLEILSDAIIGTVGSYTYNADGTLSNESKSTIQQTANSIRLSVSNSAIDTALGDNGSINSVLLDTGIDITLGKIVVTANNFMVQDQQGRVALMTSGNKIKAAYLEIDGIFSTSAGSTWMDLRSGILGDASTTALGYANTAEGNAKGYADSGDASTLQSAQNYADGKANDAYTDALSYVTNSIIPGVTQAYQDAIAALGVSELANRIGDAEDDIENLDGSVSGLSDNLDAAILRIQAAEGGLSDLGYISAALLNGQTVAVGGLVLSSLIQLGSNTGPDASWQVWSGINGVYNSSVAGNGIAAWYGGAMLDRYYSENTDANRAARTLFRMDGSGYLASNNLWWGANGELHINNNTIIDNTGNLTLSQLASVVTKLASYFTVVDYVKDGTIRHYLKLNASGAGGLDGFASDGFITAGGVGSSSGGGGGEGASLLAVWRSLTNNNSLVDADITSTLKIATAHIPDLSISKVTGLQTALNGKQDTISDLSTIRSNASLGATAYNALPNYLPLNGGLISGTLIAFNSAGLPTYGGIEVPASRTAIGYNGIAIAGIDAATDGAAIFMENAGTEKNRLVIALGDDRAQAGTDDWIEFRHYNTSGNYASIKVPFTAGTLALTSDLSAYLPLSGGTMTGGITCATSGANIVWGNFTIYGGGTNGGSNSVLIGDDAYIGDCNQDGVIGIRGVNGTNAGFQFYDYQGNSIGSIRSAAGELQWLNSSGAIKSILHEGNYSSYALSLSGGTMNNTNVVTNLNADLLDGLHADHYFRKSAWNNEYGGYDSIDSLVYGERTVDGNPEGTPAAEWADWNTTLLTLGVIDIRTKQLIFNYNKDDIYYRRRTDGGWSSMRTIAFLDSNVASATSAGNADTVDGYHAERFLIKRGMRSDMDSIYDLRNNWGNIDKGDFQGTYANEYPFNDQQYISIADSDRNTAVILFFECDPSNALGHIAVKTRGAGNWNTSYSSTGIVAYLTDNVASASQLQTNRLIWGQSFNGTQDVEGALTGVTNLNSLLYFGSNNVGIGTTSPQYKLDVNGDIGVANCLKLKLVSGTISPVIQSAYGEYFDQRLNLYLDSSSGDWNIFDDSSNVLVRVKRATGNVGIGVTSPAYKLDVSGTFRATGNSIVGGTLFVTGATTLTGALTVNNTASISGNTTIGGNATIGGNIYMTAGNSIDLDGGLDVIYYDSNNTTVYFNFDYASHFSSGIYSDSFITGGGVNASSDARLKDNLTAVSAEKAISVLMQLRPMEWVWNEKNAYLEGNIGAGLVAQEVESVLPFAVSRDTEYLSLNYNVFHAYEIAGLQNHEERIKALEKENEELKREIELLKQ